MDPSLAILEFDSIAHGIVAGDAMAKRSPLDVLRAGTVHPGRYLVLAGGGTAEVEEAVEAGRIAGSAGLIGVVFLPDVHPDVVAALGGARRAGGDALGVIETRTVTAVIEAADAGVKNADVVLRELRIADDLGGKGYVLFGGTQTEVEAAVEYGVARIGDEERPVTHVTIARLHAEMDDNLRADGRFAPHVAGTTKDDTDPRPPKGA
ncbi:MAG TPA: BMC domain-containing protein [Egicoccus sp.]|nr:BMC domain-containing protein [Egicoccus sp.]HSK21806.1 BMC domain-containing protein [Egicoccus sp.]